MLLETGSILTQGNKSVKKCGVKQNYKLLRASFAMGSTKHQLEYSFLCSAIQLRGQLADHVVLGPAGINRRLAGMTDATTLQTITAPLFLSWLYKVVFFSIRAIII